MMTTMYAWEGHFRSMDLWSMDPWAMTGTEWGFLVLRLLTTAACFLAVLSVWRYGCRRGPAPQPWLYLLAAMTFLLTMGVLTAVEAYVQVVTQAGEPIPLRFWFWLATDLAVPVAVLMLLRALQARDALEARLVAAARQDPLTGLPNRAGFAEAAALALAHAAANGRPVAAAMLDLDRFKRINDGWGHAAGDAVLRGAAHALRGALRPGDVLARMGGEEFALVLPGLSAEAALPLLDRLREAVRAGVPHPGGAAQVVTLSGGVAAVPHPHMAALEEALAAADAALYTAKQAGRNRALIAA